jgi:hypothetical protein
LVDKKHSVVKWTPIFGPVVKVEDRVCSEMKERRSRKDEKQT